MLVEYFLIHAECPRQGDENRSQKSKPIPALARRSLKWNQSQWRRVASPRPKSFFELSLTVVAYSQQGLLSSCLFLLLTGLRF